MRTKRELTFRLPAWNREAHPTSEWPRILRAYLDEIRRPGTDDDKATLYGCFEGEAEAIWANSVPTLDNLAVHYYPDDDIEEALAHVAHGLLRLTGRAPAAAQ